MILLIIYEFFNSLLYLQYILYIIFHRTLIGELDEVKEVQIDLSEVRALPLKPVSHTG